MAIKFSEVEGIEESVANTLVTAGLDNWDRLLSQASTATARRDLSRKLEIDERLLTDLVNRADLARIEGIGKIYSDLLEMAGVDTVVELSTRNSRNLHAKIKEIASTHHVKRTPNPATVDDWVEQAQELDRAIHY